MPTIRELYQSGELQKMPLEQLQALRQQAASGQPFKYSAQQKPSIMGALGAGVKGMVDAYPRMESEGKLPAKGKTTLDPYQKLELERKYKELHPSPSEQLSTMELEAAQKRGGAGTIDTTATVEPTPRPGMGQPTEPEIPPTHIEVPTGDYDKYTGIEKVKTEKNPAYARWEKQNDPKFLASQAKDQRAQDAASKMVKDRAEDTLSTITEVEEGLKGNGWPYFGKRSYMPTVRGTERYKWEANLNKLLAGKVIDVMAEMKNASRTGATGFGQLSEKEMKVLQDAATALESGLAPEDAKELLDAMKTALQKVVSGDSQMGGVQGQEVSMISPDGQEYMVDQAEADEAQQNGWRLK